ncbi:thioredoxin family protein [Membranihabitans marinus]|uniref:thioredoxin family protein n=1 Tax=Membranihabitans marinus TaxID=1227546 RepID=UPI001F1716A2|nr:thioredoxin family protein [Membranihabitans marinus]
MKGLIYGIGGLIALMATGVGTFLGINNDIVAYKIGDVVADFSLKDFDGKTVSLSDYNGSNGYIVVFTCNTCPYAKLYEDRIIQLSEKYKAKGIPLIAINPNDPSLKPGDSADEMRSRAEEKSYPFPYLVDTKGIYALFGAKKTPQIYVLDSAKKIQYIGAIDDNAQSEEGVKVNYVDAAIEAVQSNKAPTVKETRAIGCTIKPRS